MTIQQNAMKNINEFGGLELVLSELNNIKVLLSQNNKIYINLIRVYYRSLFAAKTDVETDYMEHTEDVLKVQRVFTEVLQKHDAPVARLIVVNVTYGLNRINKLRRIS